MADSDLNLDLDIKSNDTGILDGIWDAIAPFTSCLCLPCDEHIPVDQLLATPLVYLHFQTKSMLHQFNLNQIRDKPIDQADEHMLTDEQKKKRL